MHPVMRTMSFSDARHTQVESTNPLVRAHDIAKISPNSRQAALKKPAAGPGTQIRIASFMPASQIQSRRFLMRSKLAISALMIASLFGTTAIASAQTQPTTPGASSEGNAGAGANMKSGNMKSDKMKTSKAKSGTTTGMSSGSKKGSAAPGADDG